MECVEEAIAFVGSVAIVSQLGVGDKMVVRGGLWMLMAQYWKMVAEICETVDGDVVRIVMDRLHCVVLLVLNQALVQLHGILRRGRATGTVAFASVLGFGCRVR